MKLVENQENFVEFATPASGLICQIDYSVFSKITSLRQLDVTSNETKTLIFFCLTPPTNLKVYNLLYL